MKRPDDLPEILCKRWSRSRADNDLMNNKFIALYWEYKKRSRSGNLVENMIDNISMLQEMEEILNIKEVFPDEQEN